MSSMHFTSLLGRRPPLCVHSRRRPRAPTSPFHRPPYQVRMRTDLTGRNFAATINKQGELGWKYYCDPKTLLATHKCRVRSGWTPEVLYGAMKHFPDWKRDPKFVPPEYRNAEFYYTYEDDARTGLSIDQARLEHPDAVGEALLAFADQRLRQALRMFVVNGKINTAYLAGATALLELAVKFGNTRAALALINISEDTVLWEQMDPKSNLGPARDFVKTQVVQDPDRSSWEAVVTYMRHEYRNENITRQTPNQLKWGMAVLLNVAEKLEPGGKSFRPKSLIEWVACRLTELVDVDEDSLDTQARWFKCENPWKVLHRIVNHCLARAGVIPGCSIEELKGLRERCLMELARYNDPDAVFTVALRDEQFGTPTWENMIKCAAAAGNPDANWLLGIHYLTQDGLLDPKNWPWSSDDLELKLGIDYAAAGQALSIGEPPLRPRVYRGRVLATTALWKRLGCAEIGEECLESGIEHMRQTPKTPPHLLRELETFLADYRKPNQESNAGWSWHANQCADYIKEVFDAKATSELGKKLPAYMA